MGPWFSKSTTTTSNQKDSYMYFEPSSSQKIQNPNINHFTSSSVSDPSSLQQLGTGVDGRKSNYNPQNYGNYCPHR
jgi:hypothetical protein